MNPLANSDSRNAFRRALLRWYDRHRRDLPWRKTHNPYRVWISEIMLQQTRVAAVLDHYQRFLIRFPTVRSLASSTESSVLAAWSGLGYYRRARMMRLCAQAIVKNHGGHFPRAAEKLHELPGIGRYTAAAIASIAFGQPSAVVDGNVERVLSRLNGRPLSLSQCWTQAQFLVSSSRPGDHNQALMELGATICAPRSPRCGACPVATWCSSRDMLLAGQFNRGAVSVAAAAVPPRRRGQNKSKIWRALHQRNGSVQLVQRAGTASLMAGMWELPEVSSSNFKDPWRTFRHSITNTDYVVHVVRGGQSTHKGRWIPNSALQHLPITGLTRKILKAAGII